MDILPTVIFYSLYVREEGVVALHRPIISLKAQSWLKPVPRCEPSTFCAVGVNNCHENQRSFTYMHLFMMHNPQFCNLFPLFLLTLLFLLIPPPPPPPYPDPPLPPYGDFQQSGLSVVSIKCVSYVNVLLYVLYTLTYCH